MLLREWTDPAFARSFKRFAQLAVAGLALAGLAACGGGGSSTPAATAPTTPTPTPEIPITPAPATDHPNTLEAAVVIAAGATVEGSIDSPDDMDFFKVQLTDPGTVTFWTTGEADTVITLLDGDGNDLSAAAGSVSSRPAGGGAGLVAAAADTANSAGRVSVTTGLDEVVARVSGREDGNTGDYALRSEFEGNLAPRVLEALAPVTVKAGSSITVDLSGAFEDPEGGALTFGYRFGAGQVGPVSLGVTISGSIMNITSPAAMQPGPVSITVSASDPFGLAEVQVLSVTVTPGDNRPATPQTNDLNGCVDPTFERTGDGSGESCPYNFRADMTNSCSITIFVRFGWVSEALGGGYDSGAITISPGDTERTTDYCESSRQPFRFCVQPDRTSDLPSAANRCYGDDIPWQHR